ncbi:MAG: CDP-glucose 4,6-dehydratase [Thermoanaerobaculia bacterium]|nr:CDP-glucose 4,6-dehydratase [Thermoanaerobaculia bacterium]
MNRLDALAAVYRGRRVLVTGHTGFKGGWLATWLTEWGAHVHGYALAPSTEPNLFTVAGLEGRLHSTLGDVRDLDAFRAAWRTARPEIVFHLAAQPIVRESYRDPLTTVGTNVLGVTHALELAREEDAPVAVVVVTSDKCYENVEWTWGYREIDRLGGHDLYSASKAAAELVADAYRRSFFATPGAPRLATARAGNVIGGGDWTADRLVPDAVRALAAGAPVRVRRGSATRPWQHVLEPLSGYLQLGARLLVATEAERGQLDSAWNFGPRAGASRTVTEVVQGLVAAWGTGHYELDPEPSGPHEAGLLALSIDKAVNRLGWSPRWDFATTLEKTAAWYQACYRRDDMAAWTRRQIREYWEDSP